MKILDPLSGREVDLRPPYQASVDANAFTPSVRVPQDEVRSTPFVKDVPWRPEAELQTPPGPRTSLRGSQKRSAVVPVVLGALCLCGWGAFGYNSLSSAAAEREKLALITASETAREELASE